MFKRFFTLLLVVLMSIESIGAVVSDNDGSAFITKAEFDSLKNNFQSQIDQYNTSIDSKIDGAIASYLAGINLAKKGTNNVLSSGVYWSIGPFERPRWKMGICLYDFTQERSRWGGDSGNITHFRWQWRYDGEMEAETELTNPMHAYTDLIVDGINTDSTAARYIGTYTNSVHWWRVWLYQTQSAYEDSAEMNIGEWWHGGIAGNSLGNNEYLTYLSWRPQNNTTGLYVNPNTATKDGNGNTNKISLYKGSKISWDNKISCFAPIDYHCFQRERHNETSGDTYTPVMQSTRDERCYITIDKDTYNNMTYGETNRVYQNFLYRHLAPYNNSADDPFGKTRGLGSNRNLLYGKIAISNGTQYARVTGSNVMIPYRSVAGRAIGSSYEWKRSTFRIGDVPFTNLSNWNQLGVIVDSAITKNISDNNYNSALLRDGNNNTLLNLAAGLPVGTLDKQVTGTIKGKFLKDCAYSYNGTTNVLNEGTTDNTDVYIIYAKLSPFDVTGFPEDDPDLLDISPETKDAANVGKLSKCLIVRDGNINFRAENLSNKEKILYIKWERLSNWYTIGETRATGFGTLTDNRGGTDNPNHLDPPTWTYFGGGYLKLDDTFEWVQEN